MNNIDGIEELVLEGMITKEALVVILTEPYNVACRLEVAEIARRIDLLRVIWNINRDVMDKYSKICCCYSVGENSHRNNLNNLWFVVGNMLSNYEWLLNNKLGLMGE